MAFTHVHCVTTNQPNSRASFRSAITATALAELLGWNPEGETITRMLATLQSGVGIEVFSAAVPRAAGTQGVAYRLLPCSQDFPADTIPSVTRMEHVSGTF